MVFSEEIPASKLLTTKKLVLERIQEFDSVYSRFRKNSVVRLMSRQSGNYTLPADADELLALYLEMYDITGGLITPLVGGLLEDAGYDAEYSLQPGELHAVPALETVLRWSPPYLRLTEPAVLDFGAAGKGYLADIIANLLKSLKCTSFYIDASGDIVHVGNSEMPIKVGLEHPRNDRQVIGVAEIANRSLCASAANRRAWGEFHQIVSPMTRRPVNQVVATWVVANSGLLADMLATALFLVEPDTLQNIYDFSYVLMHADGSCVISEGFPGSLFTA